MIVYGHAVDTQTRWYVCYTVQQLHERSVPVYRAECLHVNVCLLPVSVYSRHLWGEIPPKFQKSPQNFKMNYAKIEFLSISDVIFSPAPWDVGVADPLETCHLWYYTKFGRSRSSHMGVVMEIRQKIWPIASRLSGSLKEPIRIDRPPMTSY